MFTGACLNPNAVVHAGLGQDYLTLESALETFVLGEGTVIVHDGSIFNESLTIDQGMKAAFVAADGQSPRWSFPPMLDVPTLTVSGEDTRVYLEGIHLRGNGDGIGLLVDGAMVDVRRSRIVQNSGGGIVAQGGATLTVENCFVGQDASNTDSVVANAATVSVLYSTLVAGDGGLGESRALACMGSSTVEVRNSLVIAVDDVAEVACAEATITYTATESEVPGDGNVDLGDVQAGWLVDTVADFHLDTPPAAIATTARWQEGDPATDIDGDLRPTTDGASDIAGADVP